MPTSSSLHFALSRSDSIFGDDLRRYAAEGRLRLVERYDDVHGMLDVDDLGRSCPTSPSARRTPAGRPACSTRSRPTTPRRGLPLHSSSSAPPVVVTGEGGTVTFGKTGTVVEADGDTPILDAAEEAGVLMPSGCRMGICFGCVLPLREGAVRDLRNGAITTAAPGDGVLIQTCINAAAGACDIDH